MAVKHIKNNFARRLALVLIIPALVPASLVWHLAVNLMLSAHAAWEAFCNESLEDWRWHKKVWRGITKTWKEPCKK